LRLELLEDRLAPATFIWTGAASDPNWSTGLNWSGGTAPRGLGGEDLVFPSGSQNFNSVNNLVSTGVVTPTFNSITISGNTYTLSGDTPLEKVLLTSTATSGSLIVGGGGGINSNITMDVILGRTGGTQFVSIDSSADLTLSGHLSGNSGLTKDGGGLLKLTNDNSNFIGAITITDAGSRILINNAKALGAGFVPTIVHTGAQLQVDSSAGPLLVAQPLILNGLGAATDGALLNIGGTTTWTGGIQLNSDGGPNDPAIGTDFRTSTTVSTLDIQGTISDLGAGHGLIKEGFGTAILDTANSYRGKTTINNGILIVQNALGLGTADGSAATGTVVNQSNTKSGTLEIRDPSGVGFTIANEQLILNGRGGFNPATVGNEGIGSLYNNLGNNTWTGNVLLGSPIPDNSSSNFGPSIFINVAANTSLLIGSTSSNSQGVVSSPNPYQLNPIAYCPLIKDGQGTLIFSANNTYQGGTTITNGILEIRDSNSLGTNNVVVDPTNPLTGGQTAGATLKFAIDAISDSVTGQTNTLLVPNNIGIVGPGFGNNVGALFSASGINETTGTISLLTDNFFRSTAIGVAPDPNPTNSTAYFTNDFHLQADHVTGNYAVGTYVLNKVGTGQLILPNNNFGLGSEIDIRQGWITARSSNSLGLLITQKLDSNAPNIAPPPTGNGQARFININENQQHIVTVENGAALHLFPTSGNLNITQNLVLSGLGISHPFNQINKEGAIENLSGVGTTLRGNITLNGQAGIGVAPVFGPSMLIVGLPSTQNGNTLESGFITQAAGTTGGITKLGSAVLDLRDEGLYTGPVDIQQGILMVQEPTALGAGNTATSVVTVETGATLALANTVPLTNGGIEPTAVTSNTPGMAIWGEKLVLNGPGNTTNGFPFSPLTVLADNTLIPTDTIVPTDNEWRGQIVLNSSININLPTGTRLNLMGTVSDNDPTGSADFVKIGGGELILTGSNTYHGRTYDGTSISTNPPISEVQQVSVYSLTGTFTLTFKGQTTTPLAANATADQVQTALNALTTIGGAGGSVTVSQSGANYIVSFGGSLTGANQPLMTPGASDTAPTVTTTLNDGGGVNDFFNPGNPQALPGGIITVASSQALGDITGGTIVQDGSTLQLEGNITVAGESLTLQGTGVSTVVPIQTWFNLGPGPINNGQTLSNTPAPITGRITGVSIDPTDPSTIYIGTAGGGVWKTRDGGKTWLPLFDDQQSSSNPKSMFIGAVAVDPYNPLIVYVGTGEANNSTDSYYGTGVYRSNDGGHTWTLLLGQGSTNTTANPLAGAAISAISIDPLSALNNSVQTNTNPRIFVSASTMAVNANVPAPGNAGIWRYDPNGSGVGQFWFNMTAVVSSTRGSGTNSGTTVSGLPTVVPATNPPTTYLPGTPGPDDNIFISFPSQGDYSDVVVTNSTTQDATNTYPDFSVTGNPFYFSTEGVLYMALGTASGDDRTFNQDAGSGFPGVGLLGGPTTTSPFYPLQDGHYDGYADNVYRCDNPTSNAPVWYIGAGNTYAAPGNPQNVTYSTSTGVGINNGDVGVGGTLTSTTPTQNTIRNGTIKLAAYTDMAWESDAQLLAGQITAISAKLKHTTVYAMVAQPNQLSEPFSPGSNTAPSFPIFNSASHTTAEGSLLSVFQSTNGGQAWAALTNQPPNAATILGNQGFYSMSVALSLKNPNLVYFGGAYGVDVYNNATGTWTDLTTGAANAPAMNVHAIAIDSGLGVATIGGIGNVYVGTDGGLWQLNPNTNNSWSNLNGNLLSITQLNGIGVPTNDPFTVYAGSQSGGTDKFSNNQTWTQVDRNAGSATSPGLTFGGSTGLVKVDPNNANTIYAISLNSEIENPGDLGRDPRYQTPQPFSSATNNLTATLRKSTNGGATWTNLITVNQAQIVNQALLQPTNIFTNTSSGTTPFALDIVNSNRLLMGGNATNVPPYSTTNPLQESLNGGASWQNLFAPISVTGIALAAYQGTFQADPAFPLVGDVGANQYVPDTIYITNGSSIRVTKNHGVVWTGRNLPGGLNSIADIEVDPNNRDHVFAVRSTFDTLGRKVYESTNAGQSWTDITTNLPDIPVWKLVIDPRTNALYVGTDRGVFTTPSSGGNWSRLGTGLPQVAVHDMFLNQSLNTLTIATYGRGAYQIFLDTTTPSSVLPGALTVLSGSATWTGPIILAGNTTISARGTQVLQTVQTGIAQASLNIVGTISDLFPGANFTLTKAGLGNIILSGANTYGGDTVISQGVLIVNNPQALGGATHGTIINTGTALWLQTDLALEPIFAQGNGILFNGHNTGAVRNISNNNTYTGTLTMLSDITIGVDTGSSLTIGSKSTLPGTGTITDGGANFGLTKELTGTLFLTSANTYGGLTTVNQGILNVQDPDALGSSGTNANGTVVLDGAQVQLQANTIITNEHLRLSGTGITNTGALENASGINTWAGPITLAQDPGFSPPTTPPINVAIGALYTDPADSLTISGQITQANPAMGLTKVGLGTVILDNATNNYTGSTIVAAGVLRIRENGALGSSGTSSKQFVLVTGTAGTFTLSYNGQATGALAFNASNLTVQNAVNALLPAGGSVVVTSAAISGGLIYTINFNGTVSGGAAIPLTVTSVGGATAIATSDGTFVQSLGALELDGSTANFNVLSEGLFLNGPGTPEVQTINVSGTQGTFTLTFNGQTTSVLPFNATDVVIQAALNGLASIGGVGGSVTVEQVPSGQFVVIFGGTLAGANQPQITGAGASGASVTTGTARDGAQGALRNIIGSNTYSGPVTLQTSSNIGVDAGTQLTVGRLQDTNPAAVPSPSMTKVGAGTLVFPNANPYTGQTNVNEGILNIRTGTTTVNGVVQSALGAVVSTVQQITLSGSLTGFFTLTFNGQTTIQMPTNFNQASLRQTIQDALNGLSSIGGVGGTVTVTQPGGVGTPVYLVSFGGTLTNAHQPQMIATFGNGSIAQITTIVDGSYGTVVNSGATLQVQGGITVSNEDLTLNGPGFNGLGALDSAANSNTWARLITLGSDASIGADGTSVLTINKPITDNGNRFGVTKDGTGTVVYTGANNNLYTGLTQVNDGLLQLNKSPVSEVQLLTINGSSGSFTLSFLGQTTGLLPFNVPANGGVGPTASIQNALQALSTIGAGNVTVVSAGTGNNAFLITFTGTLANANQPLLVVGSNTALVGTPVVTVQDGSSVGTAIAGDLTIGGTVPGTPIVQWLASNQVADTVGSNPEVTTVNGNGTLDLNGQTETLGKLVTNDNVGGDNALVTTGATGTGLLTLNALNMTGGHIDIHTATSQVILAGDVAATSDAVDAALIDGLGQLSLGGATRTFFMTRGPQAVDLIIDAVISGTGSEGLTVDGPVGAGGRLQLTAVETYTGVTTTKNGDLQVDGTIGNVQQQGGTLSGKGNVGTITDITGSTTPVATTAPGDNGSASTEFGILNSTGVTWNKGTTFFVDLKDHNAQPGVGFDQLDVSGNVNLNGATLDGTVDTAVQIGDSFTIIQTSNGGTVGASHFAEPFGPNKAFINGQKFFVDYSDPTKVVITRVKNDATISVSSNANPSVYGQQILLTALVTPEPGTGPIPTSDTVTFTFDTGTSAGIVSATVNVDSTGHATFDPQLAIPGVVTVGNHAVTATFNGDANFNTAMTTFNPPNGQVVNKDSTHITLVASPANPVYLQQTTVTATVLPNPPGAGVPTGMLTFTVDPGTPNQTQQTFTLSSGQAVLTLPANLTVGPHTVQASYNAPGDANFLPTTSSNLVIDVGQDPTGVSVISSAPISGLGQSVTFTATVTSTGPVSGLPTPTGVVKFIIDGNNSNPPQVQLNNGMAAYTTSSLGLGTHTVVVQYLGTVTWAPSTSSTFQQVVRNATVTHLVSSTNGQTAPPNSNITFTATVQPAQVGLPAPTGQVDFVIDGVDQGPVNLTVGTTSSTAQISTNTLGAGGHNITATYLGVASPPANGYAPSSDTITQFVQSASTTTLTQDSATSVVTQPVTFRAVVVPQVVSAGVPQGTVTFTFILPGQPTTTQMVNLVAGGTNDPPSSAVASFTTTSLLLAQASPGYTITATYNPASSNPPVAGSTSSAINHTVTPASTSTAVVSSINPASVGQNVTFTATVSVRSPGTGRPKEGAVTFVVTTYTGAVFSFGPVNVVSSGANVGTASFTLPAGGSTLPFTPFTASPNFNKVVANYHDAAGSFLDSSSPALQQRVLNAAVATVTSSVNPSILGNPVTFTASVTSQAANGGTPTGSVNFVIDGFVSASNVPLSNGMASFTPTFSGSVGLGYHTVVVTYSGDNNFGVTSSPQILQQVVAQTSTQLAITLGSNPTTIGQSVTYTATVQQLQGPVTPNGYIFFFVDGYGQALVQLNAAGQASVTVPYVGGQPFNGVGNHTVTATFSGSGEFQTSTTSITQVVQGLASSMFATLSANPAQVGTPFNLFLHALNSQGQPAGALNGQQAQLFLVGAPSGGTLFGLTNGAAVSTFDGNGIATFLAGGPGMVANVPGLYTVELVDVTDGLVIFFQFAVAGR
jgi:autotransporter-associated beta strand protein